MTTDIERDIRERDACYAPLPPHILPDSPEMAYIDRRTLLRLLDEAREGREALRKALSHYGQHEYACSSEHGQYKNRCDCGFLALCKVKP